MIINKIMIHLALNFPKVWIVNRSRPGRITLLYKGREIYLKIEEDGDGFFAWVSEWRSHSRTTSQALWGMQIWCDQVTDLTQELKKALG